MSASPRIPIPAIAEALHFADGQSVPRGAILVDRGTASARRLGDCGAGKRRLAAAVAR